MFGLFEAIASYSGFLFVGKVPESRSRLPELQITVVVAFIAEVLLVIIFVELWLGLIKTFEIVFPHLKFFCSTGKLRFFEIMTLPMLR